MSNRRRRKRAWAVTGAAAWAACGLLLLCGGCDGADSQQAAPATNGKAASAPAATAGESAAPSGTRPSPDELRSVTEFVQSAAKAPEGQRPRPAASQPGAAAPSATSASPPLKYDVPGAWVSQKPSSPMRQAQYAIPRSTGDAQDGELIVFYFPPGAGGDAQSNLTRWRATFSDGQGKPLADDAVRIEQREVNGLSVVTLDQSGRYTAQMPGGPPGTPVDNMRMLAAIVQTPAGNWFFRMTGPTATMAANEAAFGAMIASARQ